MSDSAKDQGQSAPTNDRSKADDAANKDADAGASQEQVQQTGPGPKVLRSHYRGMPSQWEKNLPPKKEGE